MTARWSPTRRPRQRWSRRSRCARPARPSPRSASTYAEHGIERSYHSVGAMLASRVYLGEIHFGDIEPNLTAHDAIVDRDLWKVVQRARVPRGRQPKSDRLLARLGVLRCASCGSRMIVGSAHSGKHPQYRCPPNGDCKRRVSIAAELVEGIVTEHVKAQIADVEGRASAEALAMNVIAERDAAQAKLDAAIATLAEVMDEPVSIETIAKLRAARDAAQEEVDRLGGEAVVERVRGAADWDRLSVAGKRDLIKIHAPTVRCGSGTRSQPRHDRAARRVAAQPPGRGRAGSRRGCVAACRSYDVDQRRAALASTPHRRSPRRPSPARSRRRSSGPPCRAASRIATSGRPT